MLITSDIVAVYDALSLARRPADSVQKEFKVDPVARASNTKGLTMDIVYIQLGNMKPQVINSFSVVGWRMSSIKSRLYKIVFLSLPQEYTSARVGVS